MTPSGAAPTAAMNYAAAYDPDHDAVVMMGGAGTDIEFMPPRTLREVWSLSLGDSPTWRDLGPDGFPAGPGGFPDLSFSLVNDPVRHRFAAFSGYDTLAKSLVLDPTPTWSDLAAAGAAPNRREGLRMVRAPLADELLLVGDYPDAAWHLPLAGGSSWRFTSLAEDVPPSARDATLSPDPERRRMLLCGGLSPLVVGRTWIWAPTDAVWSFSLEDERWTRLDNVRVPHGGLTGHHAIGDPRHDRLLLIGGSRPGDSLGTTVPNPFHFELSLGTMSWSEHDIGVNPGADPSSGIALDESRDRLLIPGRTTDDFYSGQVWALPLDGDVRWTTFDAPGQAMTSELFGESAIYDPLRARMIVEGGAFENRNMDRGPLWALDFSGEPFWAPLAAAGRPPVKRIWQFSAYDRVEDRMLTFGGTLLDYPDTPHSPTTDLWSLALGGVPTWDSLQVYGPIPSPAPSTASNFVPRNAAVGFDPENRKPVVARGPANLVTSVLDFTPPTRLVQCLATGAGGHGRGFERGGGVIAVVILSEPDFDARRLDPRWLRLDGAPVERTGRGWKTRVLDADGDGRLDLECTFARRGAPTWRDAASSGGTASEDRAGDPNHAHSSSASLALTGVDPEGYPLRGEVVAPAEGRAGLEAEATADAAPAFALMGVTPNPSVRGRLNVRFSLADPGPARLELLDLAGRVMISREVGGATGERLVALTAAEAPRPGVYWLRLRQAERLAIRKVVVLR